VLEGKIPDSRLLGADDATDVTDGVVDETSDGYADDDKMTVVSVEDIDVVGAAQLVKVLIVVPVTGELEELMTSVVHVETVSVQVPDVENRAVQNSTHKVWSFMF
jgi:hypothetical protein